MFKFLHGQNISALLFLWSKQTETTFQDGRRRHHGADGGLFGAKPTPAWSSVQGSTARCPQTDLVQLEMWANAQCDGRPAEYRWHPLFNAAVWLTPTTRVPFSNAAKDAKPVEISWGAQTSETISAASGPKFTILCGHVEEILMLNKFFFSDCGYMS